jgi:DNA-binding response OmpR family regulator
MESRLVLIIEDDEQTASKLAAAIREADYEVVVSPTAAEGLDVAIEIKPDCVVCDMDLPDENGFWVARSVRAHPSAVSVTPFVFLSAYDDTQTKLEGFEAGADVFLTKPFVLDEAVAQIRALVEMAARLRHRRDSIVSLAPGTPYGSLALEGDMREMSIATVLSILGMERRTGMFEVVSKKRRAQIEIVGGYVAHGTLGGTRVSALAAMRAMLSWKVGRYSFTPLPPTDPPSEPRTVQALLLDAAKAEDEEAESSRSGSDLPVATSFGGPPSRPDDTGPPSSRAMRERGPMSLTFDLIPSRPPEALPAAEVDAAVEGPISLMERRLDPPLSEEAAISVKLEDLESDWASAERLLHDELTPNVLPPVAIAAARHTPTPPSGIPLVNVRSKPAMLPPPDSSPRIGPLPAPPAPPRPAIAPQPSHTRVPHRASPKK